MLRNQQNYGLNLECKPHHPPGGDAPGERREDMKSFEVKYRLKKRKRRVYSLVVRAVDEKDAKRVAYNRIDNRIFDVV